MLPINEDVASLQLLGLAVVHLGLLDLPGASTVLQMSQDAKTDAIATLGWLVVLPGKTQEAVLVLAVLELDIAPLLALRRGTWGSLPKELELLCSGLGFGCCVSTHESAAR
jgi:hypothetical protein